MSEYTTTIEEIPPSKDKVYKKLGDIIKDLEPAKKNTENTYFSNKYADLNQLLAIVKPILVQHNVTMTQLPFTDVIEGTGNSPAMVMIGVDTVIIDNDSGESISNELLLPCTGLDPQKAGSAISYAKRYAIKALFLMEDVDDDGNSATHAPPVKQQPTQQPTSVATINQVQGKQWPEFDQISKDIGAAKDESQLDMVYKWGIQDNPKLTSEQTQTLVEQCRQRKAGGYK